MKANSELLGLGKRYIPRRALNRIGSIFLEGVPKYGENNWQKGRDDTDWQKERYEHAYEHFLKWYEGDRTEDHLAKVAWFCTVMLHFDELEKEQPLVVPEEPKQLELEPWVETEQPKAVHFAEKVGNLLTNLISKRT